MFNFHLYLLYKLTFMFRAGAAYELEVMLQEQTIFFYTVLVC